MSASLYKLPLCVPLQSSKWKQVIKGGRERFNNFTGWMWDPCWGETGALQVDILFTSSELAIHT